MFELGFSFPIALRPLTHASIRWTSKRVEPKIRQLVTDLILALDQEEDKGSFLTLGQTWVSTACWSAHFHPTEKS